MAINLYALNATEVTLTRPAAKPAAYRLDKDKFKNDWESLKNNSDNLLQVSKNVIGCESTLSIEGLANAGELNRNLCNYSSDVFFQKEMPKITTNGGYMVGGVMFSKEELEQCRMVMKTAVDEIGCGIGKNTNIDYKNYAQMGIAASSVRTYAGGNLTEEQAAVVNKAMQEYNQALIDMEKETLDEQGFVDSHRGAISEYYGKEVELDENEIDWMNRFKEELRQTTGKQYAPTQKGITATIQSATNKKLIDGIMDLFSNLDSTDKNAVDAAIKKYGELIKPAREAFGMKADSIGKALEEDRAFFKKQIADILLAAQYHATDYRI